MGAWRFYTYDLPLLYRLNSHAYFDVSGKLEMQKLFINDNNN